MRSILVAEADPSNQYKEEYYPDSKLFEYVSVHTLLTGVIETF